MGKKYSEIIWPLKEGENDVKKKVAKILCHQQFNEQFVQMVAKSVSKVVSHDGQKSKIICTKQSQEDIPILVTKKDFKLRRKLFDWNIYSIVVVPYVHILKNIIIFLT